jgi:hypothetical protein
MNLPLSLARRIHTGAVDWPQIREAADRVVKADDARRSRDRSRPKRGAGRTKEEKRAAKEERLERLAAIRVTLWSETAGLCAACDRPLPFVKMHAHHLCGGPERQIEERLETLAPVHGKCHDNAHGKHGADPLPTLNALLAWCGKTGRTLAAAALRKRIAKVEESRRTVGIRIREAR